MSRPLVSIVAPGQTSSGGSAFTQQLCPALEEVLGEPVALGNAPSRGRIDLAGAVTQARNVVFLGSRAVRVAGAGTVFWPLNVAPLERHVRTSSQQGRHNRLRHLALLPRLRRSVAAADGLVFGSMYARSLYMSRYADAARLPYAINPGGMPSLSPVLPRHTDDERPLVLLVSHLYPYKGIVEFVEAVAQAIPRLPENVRFRVAGADRDRRYAAQVHRRVEELGLTDRLAVAPAWGEEMPGLYADATLAVFMSTCENAGSFALYDGLHAGMPTVCSDRSSMPEMVGGHVRMVNPFNPEAVAEAMVDVLGRDDERARLASLAQAWSAKAPTWSDRARGLVAFLESLEGVR